MRFSRSFALAVLYFSAVLSVRGLEKQPASAYHARRVALAGKLQGGVGVFFAAEEAVLDLTPYRQDPDFYYLTGWNEPGAALVIVAESPAEAAESTPLASPHPARAYQEILFLPTRNLANERYTGVKVDALTPGASERAGVDSVRPMTELPRFLTELIADDRRLGGRLWAEPDNPQAKALLSFVGTALGRNSAPPTKDVSALTTELREVKDPGEIELLKKASAASIAGQRAMFQAVKPGVTELAIAGIMTAAWMEHGCERPSYAPIVGSGINSTTLHYSENSGTLHDGDLVTVDAACEYSMYASDITRTVPANGHYTPRQREIFEIVRGAQQAAIDSFVAGKSKLLSPDRRDPDVLDNAAYNYINTHGKDLHGAPLGKYWLHGLGHLVGIDVHDPAVYPVVLKPGMVFTIEPGVYIAEEKIGVRLECVFLVGADGKLIDLTADLPHTPDEIEAAMSGK
jgi:Xaa-Pro aminopeptidase